MSGLKLLQKHEVEYNVLACVARETAKRPSTFTASCGPRGGIHPVHAYCRASGGCGEWRAESSPVRSGGSEQGGQGEVSVWSVEPEKYGDFLIAVYEEWCANDVGKIFVMNFEWPQRLDRQSVPVCVHSVQCGRSLVLEHNGDVYAAITVSTPNIDWATS